jgi:tRNA modification GTPase
MGNPIFALASGAGRAAVAVMRVSGAGTGGLVEALCGALPEPRRASLRRLRHDGVVLDRALVLWLPGPRQLHGRGFAELHLHGGRRCVKAVAPRWWPVARARPSRGSSPAGPS